MNIKQTILLVDDSENDMLLLLRAFKKAGFECPLREVYNGEQAISYLAGEGIYNNRDDYPMPSIMLLDLNMPRKNGFDVLAWVRSQPIFNSLSVIILTASMRAEDVQRAFDLGANSFLLKPSNMNALTSMVQCLRDWTRINHFPPLNEMVTR
jgi:CheY-like chemotaxis protein